jgi:hypothetical protein
MRGEAKGENRIEGAKEGRWGGRFPICQRTLSTSICGRESFPAAPHHLTLVHPEPSVLVVRLVSNLIRVFFVHFADLAPPTTKQQPGIIFL